MVDAELKITQERIDELTRFLGWFENDKQPVGRLETPPSDEHGVRSFPYFDYQESVEQFFSLAAQPWWTDADYLSKETGDMVADDQVIDTATLDEIKTMLTWCVRGERFCDGHWATLIADGRIQRILKRLQELRDTA